MHEVNEHMFNLLRRHITQEINHDGTLTGEGQRALGCIRNGAMLAGGAGLLGLPTPIIGKGLSLLAGGIVKMDEINNVASSMGGIGVLSHLLQ